MNIGILGGTFDPPHLGHLNIATSALSTGMIDRVIFIPTAIPPHKSQSNLSNSECRLKMTELMCSNNPALEVSDIEIKRNGLSYTILTLKELTAKYPNDNLRLIIGADMALCFDTWKNAEEIIDLARPLISARPGYIFDKEFGLSIPKNLPPMYRKALKDGIFETKLLDISSTQIRNSIVRNDEKTALKCLSPDVYDYIIAQKLYQ